MKRKTLKMSLYEAFTSKLFFFSMFAVVGVCVINVMNLSLIGLLRLEAGNAVRIFTNIFNIGMFNGLIFLVSAFAYASNFCNEWNFQYIKPLVIRSGVFRYSVSKIITCTLSTFFAVLIGMVLFFTFIFSITPFFYDFELALEIPPYGSLIPTPFAIFFFLAPIVCLAIASACWAVLGMTISVLIPNKFIAISTPFVASYALQWLTYKLPQAFSIIDIIDGSCFLDQPPLWNFLYSLGFFSLLIIAISFLFHYLIKRRVRCELV